MVNSIISSTVDFRIAEEINRLIYKSIVEKLKYVYIVGVSDAEANFVKSFCLTYKGALKEWDNVRLGLIEQEEHMKRLNNLYNDNTIESIIEFKNRNYESDDHIFKLSCEDPTQIDNYPQETPYIMKYELKE